MLRAVLILLAVVTTSAHAATVLTVEVRECTNPAVIERLTAALDSRSFDRDGNDWQQCKTVDASSITTSPTRTFSLSDPGSGVREWVYLYRTEDANGNERMLFKRTLTLRRTGQEQDA